MKYFNRQVMTQPISANGMLMAVADPLTFRRDGGGVLITGKCWNARMITLTVNIMPVILITC